MQVAQLVILNFFFATGYQSIVRNAVCLVQLATKSSIYSINPQNLKNIKFKYRERLIKNEIVPEGR